VGMFHLITHAFFKALLFLGAGSVIHGCHEEQDIRRMGGLRRLMPVTFATYAVGMMALAGFPLFFSGFWSKDEILHSALGWPISRWPFYLGLIGALLTAFYMTRQMCYVFFGHLRGSRVEEALADQSAIGAPRESPRVMTVPLIVLAAFAVLLSVVGTPVWPWFHDYLMGHHGESEGFTRAGLGVMGLSTLIVAAGVGLAWWLYGRKPATGPEAPDAFEAMQPDIFELLRRKFFVDELYDGTVVKVNAWCARACDWLDQFVWNGIVWAIAYVALGLSWLNHTLDEWVVNLGFDQACNSMRLSGKGLSLWQNGQVQRYLRVVGLALVILALVFIWGGHGQ